MSKPLKSVTIRVLRGQEVITKGQEPVDQSQLPWTKLCNRPDQSLLAHRGRGRAGRSAAVGEDAQTDFAVEKDISDSGTTDVLKGLKGEERGQTRSAGHHLHTSISRNGTFGGDQVVLVGSIGIISRCGPAVVDHQGQTITTHILSLQLDPDLLIQGQLSGRTHSLSESSVSEEAYAQTEGEVLSRVS